MFRRDAWQFKFFPDNPCYLVGFAGSCEVFFVAADVLREWGKNVLVSSSTREKRLTVAVK